MTLSNDLSINTASYLREPSYFAKFDVPNRFRFGKKQNQTFMGYIFTFQYCWAPCDALADFLTMEYSTINRNFINSAHQDGKEVYVWDNNDSDAMSRMMFYGGWYHNR